MWRHWEKTGERHRGNEKVAERHERMNVDGDGGLEGIMKVVDGEGRSDTL